MNFSTREPLGHLDLLDLAPPQQGLDVPVELPTVVRRDRVDLRVHVALHVVEQLTQCWRHDLRLLLPDHLDLAVAREHVHDR